MSEPSKPTLGDLEKLLAALPPRPAGLSRDHLLYRAGQVSMRTSWAWPFAAVVMSVATGCLAMVVVLRPLPEPVVRIVHIHVPAAQPEVPAPPSSEPLEQPAPAQTLTRDTSPPALSYWRMQQQALRFGVEGLPTSMDSDDPPAPPRGDGPDLSAGSRPRLLAPSSAFYYGEP